MDIGAFIQENRRWLVCCVGGVIVYLIGYAVIHSVYDETAPTRGITALARSAPQQVYNSTGRDELIEEQEQLEAERARLQQMLAFERSERFQLAAGTEADRYLFQVGRALKQGVLDAANERDIEVVDKEIAWDVPTGVDEIKRVLFALELLDEAIKRLFAAHDAARQADPEAVGLRAVRQLRTEAQRRGGNQPFRNARRGAVDLRDYVDQERLTFKFEADAATVTGFFEACRTPGRTLVLERVQMQQPDRIGEPVVVTGSLTGIAFKEAPK